jgi:Got1/Sft2-like family
MMNSMNASSMDSGFDYRSLLPTRSDESSGSRPSSSGGFFGAGSGSGDAGTGGDDGEEPWCSCEMTWRERLLGCGTCMIAGYLLSFGSFFRMASMLKGEALPYVLNVTVGNLLALGGSCFLSGPKSQFNKMWHESRRTATTLYLGSLVLTILVALVAFPGRSLILILLLLSQYVTVTWYCLSYIPFAREWISSYMNRRWGDVMN